MLDPEPVASVNGDAVWRELRAARYAELKLEGADRSIHVYATHLHHKDVERKGGADLEGVRLRETSVLLDHWRSTAAASGEPAMILADFNQARRCDCTAEEWSVVSDGLRKPHVAQPEDDGVGVALESAGFRCCYDEPGSQSNFGGRRAPPLTHWTGTVVDFMYLHGQDVTVAGNYVSYSTLSDHLPVIADLVVPATRAGVRATSPSKAKRGTPRHVRPKLGPCNRFSPWKA